MKSHFLLLSLLLSSASLISSSFVETQSNHEDEDIILPKNALTSILQIVINKILADLQHETLVPELSLGSIGSLDNIDIIGLDTVKVDKLEGPTGVGRTDISNLTVTIQELRITGHYHLVDLPLPGPIHIFGDGDLYLLIQKIRLFTALSIEYKGGLFNVIDIPEFDLTVDNIEVNFENLMDGAAAGDLLNEIIKEALPGLVTLVPEIVQENKDVIDPILSDFFNCAKTHATNIGACFTGGSLFIKGI